MADKIKKIPPGTRIIDITRLTFVKEQAPSALQGLRSEQDGYTDARTEILANQAECGEDAGITNKDFQKFVLADEQIELIDAYLPAARKIVEMLEETRRVIDDQRQRQVSGFAQSVESRVSAHGDEALLAKYEKTREYRSAIAVKAVRTRQKNAAAAEAAAVQAAARAAAPQAAQIAASQAAQAAAPQATQAATPQAVAQPAVPAAIAAQTTEPDSKPGM